MSHKIDSYSFGNISIDGEAHTSDLIITPGRVITDWWRESGHSLSMKDLREVLADSPEVLIVGIGANSVMKPPEATIKQLEEKGIKVLCLATGDAVKEYNRRAAAGENVVAALHLTC